jgi:cytoskeletal protein CcmA (bactofilin family)
MSNHVDFDCLLAEGAVFNGDITFSNGIQINGTINGNVTARPGAASLLIIGDKALIKGNVQATEIVVIGQLQGNLASSGTIRLSNTARVTGDVYYNKLDINSGAIINGELKAGNSQVTEIKRVDKAAG